MFISQEKELKSFFKIFTDLKDVIALMICNKINRRFLPEAWRFLPGLILQLSEFTLISWYYLNSLEGDDLLCVALIGFVLLLLFYLVCSVYKFVRLMILSSNVRRYVRRKGGKLWSRRQVFWREMNISRSEYIMIALQRLDCDRKTGDLYIPMFTSSYSKIGTTNAIVDTRELDRAKQNGQSQRLSLRSVLSSSALGTGAVNSQVLGGLEQGGQLKRLSLRSEVSSSVVGACSVNTGACDGAQQDGESERLSLRSVLSSGLGTGPVNSQVLDGSE